MASLKIQKRLASSILKCGKRRVWIDPNESSEISLANSRSWLSSFSPFFFLSPSALFFFSFCFTTLFSFLLGDVPPLSLPSSTLLFFLFSVDLHPWIFSPFFFLGQSKKKKRKRSPPTLHFFFYLSIFVILALLLHHPSSLFLFPQRRKKTLC